MNYKTNILFNWSDKKYILKLKNLFFSNEKMKCPGCSKNWFNVKGVTNIFCNNKFHSFCNDCFDKNNFCGLCQTSYQVECEIVSCYDKNHKIILTKPIQRENIVEMIDKHFSKIAMDI